MHQAESGGLGPSIRGVDVSILPESIALVLHRAGSVDGRLTLRYAPPGTASSRYFEIVTGEGASPADVHAIGAALDELVTENPWSVARVAADSATETDLRALVARTLLLPLVLALACGALFRIVRLTPRNQTTTPHRAGLRRAFALLSVASLLPLLLTRYVPLVDLPEHASQVALWSAYQIEPALRREYELNLWSPYSGTYFLWRGLTLLGLSVESAGRIIVAVCIVGLPLGANILLKARERPTEWALLTFPLVFTRPLAWGFLPFCLGMTILLPALAMQSGFLRRGGIGRGLSATALGLLLVWCHAIAAGFWGLLCGLFVLFDPAPWWRRVAALVTLLPAGALLFFWVTRPGGHAPMSPLFTLDPRSWWVVLFEHAQGGPATQAARAGFVVSLFVLVAAAIAALRDPGSRPPGVLGAIRSVLGAWDGPLIAGAVLAFVFYLVLPYKLFGAYDVNARFAPASVLLLTLALPAVPFPRARRAALAGAAATALLLDWNVARAYRAFDRLVGDASSLFAALPKGASVNTPAGATRFPAPFTSPVLDHFAVWAQLDTLGPVSTFTDLDHMIVRDAPESAHARYETRLVPGNDQALRSESGHLPDVLVFVTPEPPAETLRVEGATGTYRLTRRTGMVNAFVRSAP